MNQPGEGGAVAPRQAVASAIQDLVAARLARGFLPVAVLFLAGLAELVWRGWDELAAWLLPGGALVAAAAMLAHGLRVVQEAFGRPRRVWMSLAAWASVLPLGYGLWVLGWWGLRRLAMGGGLAGLATGILFAGLGTWVLRAWMRLVEAGQLARLMTVGLEQRGEEA